MKRPSTVFLASINITQPLGSISRRSGLTLSEVLISMLIMSVGVVCLATLFPISVLRTAQATQLTHAVFLRNNAEAAVESNLGLLNNSQISTPLAVVDPLGSQIIATPQLGGAGGVNRTSGGVVNTLQAQQLASLPDTWSLVLEDKVTDATVPYQITIGTAPAGIAPASGNFRLVMFDVTGKLVVLRPLNSVTGPILGWTSSKLPTGFVPARVRVEVQDIRYSYMLTVRKRGIPTVLNDTSWSADIDVVVFFNRFFKAASATPEPGDETMFQLTFPVNGGFDGKPGVGGVNDDGDVDGMGNPIIDETDGTENGWPGSDDNRTIIVSGSPFLKKGSYMLETSMLKWYRIVDFNRKTGAVLLDQDIRFSPNTNVYNGIFMKGIVDVFPLGTRTGQQ